MTQRISIISLTWSSFPAPPSKSPGVLKLANEHRFPVVPRGAGTGFTGGTIPVEGGVVLVLTKMNKILKIDQENLLAIVEPGVITYDLQQEVEKIGLFFSDAWRLRPNLTANLGACLATDPSLCYLDCKTPERMVNMASVPPNVPVGLK
jgi:hypothetical protein